MTSICLIGIIISTGALTLIAAIMHGFEMATMKTLQGMTPDLIIRSSGAYLDSQKIGTVLESEFKRDITAYSPTSIHHLIIQHPDDSADVTHLITAVTIDPLKADTIVKIPFAPSCMPHNHTSRSATHDKILIGSELAADLGIHCEDKVVLRYPDSTTFKKKSLSFLTTDATIGGIFHTGLTEWDNNIIFIPPELAAELFDDGALSSQINVKLAHPAALPEVQKSLKKRLKLSVISWYDLNPALMSALNLERIGMLLILSLIVLITGITTISLLSMQLLHHQRTIALLRSLGMSSRDLVKTFMYMSLIITGAATIIGIGVAAVASYCIDHYQLITLPQVYYISHVPAVLSGNIIALVISVTCCITLLAAWYPARQLTRIPLARLLAEG